MLLLLVVGFLIAVASAVPVSVQSRIARIDVSRLRSVEELVSAAVALSLDGHPTESVCNRLRGESPSYAARRASSIARCESEGTTIPEIEPSNVADLYHLVMTNPEAKHFQRLIGMIDSASQAEQLMLLDAGTLILSSHSELKSSKTISRLISTFDKIVKEISSDSTITFINDSTSVAVKATHLLSAAYSLQSSGNATVDNQLMHNLSALVTGSSHSTSVHDIAAAIRFEATISSTTDIVLPPFAVAIVDSKDGVMTLKLTNMLGAPIAVNTVKVESCQSSTGSVFPSGGSSVKPIEEGKFQLKFEISDAAPGVYFPTLRLEFPTGISVLHDSPELSFTVYGSVEISKFKIWTASARDKSISSIEATYAEESQDTLEITPFSSHLNIAFDIDSNLENIAYVGVGFSNLGTGDMAILTPSKKPGGKYRLKLKYTHPTFSNRIPGNGSYKIQVLISDIRLPEFLKWNVCNAEINLMRLPGAVRLVHTYDHMIQPGIHHAFRGLTPRCNPILSLFFAAIVIVPLFALIPIWRSVGLNTIYPGILGLFFHATLTSCLIILSFYWFSMTLFDLLLWLLVLAPITVVIGNCAFKSHAQRYAKMKDD